MEDFAELMQRLLEIQSGGRQRSPELIAEDKRLMDDLTEKNIRQDNSANPCRKLLGDEIRWDEKASLRRDAVRSQVSTCLPRHEN